MLRSGEPQTSSAELEKAEGDDILGRLPNHCFITPETFIKTKGSKQISAKDLALLTSSENSRVLSNTNDENQA
jgi:hypothetical protein